MARKPMLTRSQRFWRLVRSLLQPGAYLHALKLLNYYNVNHVRPLREMTLGADPSISPTATFSNAARISAGDRLRLGAYCQLWAGPGSGRIVLGDDVMFGPHVLVTAAGYRYDDGHPVTRQEMDEADVVVGDDVWIGAKCIVLPGARIGDGAIVGAGSVVRGEIPAMAIAVGVPARVVGTRRTGATP